MSLSKIYQQIKNGFRVYRDLAKIGYRPWQKLVIFDVGSNNGTAFCHMPHWCFRSQFYAFEPTPSLVAFQQQFYGRFANYHIIPQAVGENPGRMSFNVAGQADWGCSSLLEFSEGLDATCPDRIDFKVTEKIDVEVVRLDTFIKKNNILRIDFLHIDTQGTDLSVLRSLGDTIQCVQSGEIEVPGDNEFLLYKNQHTREEALDFLRSNGFEIWKIEPSWVREDNVFFRRN